MSNQDIRWLQRFEHFKQAHAQLKEALSEMAARELSRLEKRAMCNGSGLSSADCARLNAVFAQYPDIQ